MTTKGNTTTAAPSDETALANWDEELARQAAVAAEQEASTGGDYFSLRGGQLKLHGLNLPDNQMAVIILDFIKVNAFYDGPFDAETPQTPLCYALGRDEKTLAPHEQAERPQHEGCAKCPHNQWGSLVVNNVARRGKECRNLRRLLLIPGGSLTGGEHQAPATTDQILQAPMAYLSVPPTSVKIFSTYVTTLNARKLPPRAVYTKVRLLPDTKTVYKLEFTPLGPVPRELIGAMMQRAQEAEALIAHPFPMRNADAGGAPAAAGGGKAAPKGPAKKRKY